MSCRQLPRSPMANDVILAVHPLQRDQLRALLGRMWWRKRGSSMLLVASEVTVHLRAKRGLIQLTMRGWRKRRFLSV